MATKTDLTVAEVTGYIQGRESMKNQIVLELLREIEKLEELDSIPAAIRAHQTRMIKQHIANLS